MHRLLIGCLLALTTTFGFAAETVGPHPGGMPVVLYDSFGNEIGNGAQIALGVKTGTYSSAGTGQYGVTISSATTLTVPAGALFAQICISGAAAKYTDDGVTTPTSSVGLDWPIGCSSYAGPLSTFKIIGSGSTMNVSYYK